jgi:hypothetical protein
MHGTHSQEVSRTSHLQLYLQHPMENVQPCLFSLRQSFHTDCDNLLCVTSNWA